MGQFYSVWVKVEEIHQAWQLGLEEEPWKMETQEQSAKVLLDLYLSIMYGDEKEKDV